MKDYYKILGVSKDASEDELKRVYKRLAMKYHPDRNREDPKAAEEKFKEVKEAYEVLIDPQKRQMVDQGIDPNDPQMGGFGGGGFGGFGGADAFSDLFSNFFGGGFGQRSSRRQTRQMRGADLQYHVEITLEEAIMGCKKDIKYDNYVACETCNGSGAAESGSLKDCPKCHGSGQVQVSNGIFATIQECPQCHGRGKIVNKPCKKCHGDGRVKVSQTVTVTIPQGVDDGVRLKLSGKGQAAPYGGIPGDLYVLVSVKQHDIFVRNESDLYCEVPISFTTAALGGTVDVPTISGSVSLTIPPETQTGKRFRLRGKGIKSLHSGIVGDIIVQVTVETPVNLNNTQKDLLKKLAASLGQDVVATSGDTKKSSSDSKQTNAQSPKQESFAKKFQRFFDDLKKKKD